LRPVIILFAKAPQPGQVKTRLIPNLTAGQAAALHSAFVQDTLAKALQIRSADVELHTGVPCPDWADYKVPQRLQCSGDLGARMYDSLRAALGEGRPQAVILGTDSPTLPASHLIELLDGGYYAFAARRIHPAMFDGVPWSAPDTLDRTIDAVRACGLGVAVTSPWYDVDEPADLLRLEKEPDLPPHTSQCLREFATL